MVGPKGVAMILNLELEVEVQRGHLVLEAEEVVLPVYNNYNFKMSVCITKNSIYLKHACYVFPVVVHTGIEAENTFVSSNFSF